MFSNQATTKTTGQPPLSELTPLQRQTNHHFLIPIMSKKQKKLQILAIGMWIIALIYFWLWWLQPEHNVNTFRYVLTTVVIAWLTLIPLYPLIFVINGRKPHGKIKLPHDTRVAMVVTKAQSEPFSVVKQTLTAMLEQDYPHDTWLADEDPGAESIAWCKEHDVKISTRKGVEAYHRKSWPRRTRCKEGNLAYFYDHYGYENYDIVSQLDADHVPSENYLTEILKPFVDPAVGYVSAPSICDANAEKSWAARSRLYAECALQGALQSGHSNGWAPLCFGSHYAVRTQALREIGGLGPELAEDHSTTLMMNASGWRGVHAVDAIANGDGPNCFSDMITQEFQWSRSIVTILLSYLPNYYSKLPPKLRFQFIFSELWYPLFSLFMLVMYVLPIYALVKGESIVGVSYLEFILHFMPLPIGLILLARSWRDSKWCRPVDSKVLSWEGALFLFVRWPWSLLGSLLAVRDSLASKFVDFHITPKGSDAIKYIPVRAITPYAVLSIASALPVLFVNDPGTAGGFYFFAATNAIIYAAIVVVILFQHCKENQINLVDIQRFLSIHVLTAILICMFGASALLLRAPDGVEALVWGTDIPLVTKVSYDVSGAGIHGEGTRKVRFRSPWSSDQ